MAKRKSTAERALDGNPGNRPLTPKARPDSYRPLEPTELGEAGLAEWRRLADALEQVGKLSEADEGLLMSTAISYQRVREAEGVITQQGLIVAGDKGVLVKNPACQLSRDYTTQYHKGLQLLGINAASRPDVAPAQLTEDPYGQLD